MSLTALIWFAAALVTLMLLTLLMMVRNNLTYFHRMRALKYITRKAMEDLMQEDAPADRSHWDRWHARFESYGSYNKQVFQIWKWTYRQYYPGLEAE